MSGRQAAEVAVCFYERISDHDAAGAAALVATDYVGHGMGGGGGPDSVRRDVETWLQAVPDLEIVVRDVIAEGDRAVVRMHLQGTHRGVFAGIPPRSGRSRSAAPTCCVWSTVASWRRGRCATSRRCSHRSGHSPPPHEPPMAARQPTLEVLTMTRILTTLEIDRPVEDVFTFLTDLDNAPRWTVGLLEVRHEGPLRAGAEGVDVRQMGRKQVEMPWRVTRFEPPHAVAFSYDEPFPLTATFTFVATANGTEVTCDSDLRPTGLYRLLAPVIAREGRKTDEQQFQNAKRILEGRTAEPSG